MRTKTLFIAALLGAASIVASTAQVYSVNVVGYVNRTFTVGLHMFSNPLMGEENTLGALLPNAPIGTQVFTWENGSFVPHTFAGPAGWQPSDPELMPGEGAFLRTAAEFDATFVGEVMQGDLVTSLPAGLSIKSSMVPAAELLTDIGFPAEQGDQVYYWRNGGYVPTTYVSGLGAFQPVVDPPAVGEAFFVRKQNAADWTRNFTVE
jgi:hypothetical protein